MTVRRFSLGLALVLTIGFGTWPATNSPAQETDKPAASAALAKKLLDRINLLEARVAELEQQQSRKNVFDLQRQPQLSFTRPLRQVPENWGRGEINGMEYFIVPLQHSEASSGKRVAR